MLSDIDTERVGGEGLVIAKWGFKWIKYAFNFIVEGGPASKLADRLLKDFEQINGEPSAFVEITYFTEKKLTPVQDGPVAFHFDESHKQKTRHRLGKGMRSKFSLSLGKVAYNKFGQRAMNDANILVTRKWIQKYLDENFKDLRTCDKNLAIDRALFISFIPTTDFNRYKLVMATPSMETRMSGVSPWGRIFRLRRDLE